MTEVGASHGVLASNRVVVFLGPGGVGKTTTAAACAIAAARSGRATVVLTVDPARRLEEALGAGSLGNEPRAVPGRPGLWAAVLDPKETFDSLVRAHAASPKQAERILVNRLYQSVSSSLSGTHEYMAVEKLDMLAADDRFDLVVVDTPPAVSALGILEAPHFLGRLFDSWIYRVLIPGRAVTRVATAAAHTALRPLIRVVGATVVDDAIGFFRAFEGMEQGFRTRAEGVLALLRSDRAGFVIVTDPTRSASASAVALREELTRFGLAPAAVVANRLQRGYLAGEEDAAWALHRRLQETPWESAAQLLGSLEHRRALQIRAVAGLAAQLGDLPLFTTPDQGPDIDLDELATVLEALLR